MNTRQKPDPSADTLPSPDVEPQGLESANVAIRRDAHATVLLVEGGAGGADCLTDSEIFDYVEGRASDALQARIQQHIDACKSCAQMLLAAVGEESLGNSSSAGIGLTTFAPGSVVKDRYLIERFVGKGGMGEVYAALDRLMQKRVALKTLLCTSTDDPRAVRKLFAEVLNAQRVGHPQVCRINELQEHQDPISGGPSVPFFTMEFVEGERLGTRLRRSALPLAEVRVVARQLLDGLQAAHAKGVLHLDFKSDNVMLRNGGSAPDAVIMDFGLSRALDSEARMRTSEQQQGAGTLPYMALEQLECRANLGPPVDVYAYGVVLYEMLTGRLPFQGDSLGAILLKQLRERPEPPSAVVPRLNPELDAFVLKCLSSDPRQRFSNAAHALAALDRIEQWEVTRRRVRWMPWAALALLIAALVFIASLGERQVIMSSLPAPAPTKADAPADDHVVRGPTQPVPPAADIPTQLQSDPETTPSATADPTPAVPPTKPANEPRPATTGNPPAPRPPLARATKPSDESRAATPETRVETPAKATPGAADSRPEWARHLARPLPLGPARAVVSAAKSAPDSGR